MRQVKVQEVLAALERLAPPALAESWDNVGLLVESGVPVSGILTTLDITDAVADEAAARGCQLIVSHHPVIFHPVRSLHYNNVIYKLARADISAICMHTNLDCADGGTGDTLAALLGLEQVEHFTADGDEALGRIGVCRPALSARALAQHCRDVLHAPVRFVDGGHPVGRVAVVTGAGDCVEDALRAGAQALVTGEAGYHKALEAAAAGLTLIAAGHYGTEAPIAGVLARYLEKEFPGVQVCESRVVTDPYQTL